MNQTNEPESNFQKVSLNSLSVLLSLILAVAGVYFANKQSTALAQLICYAVVAYATLTLYSGNKEWFANEENLKNSLYVFLLYGTGILLCGYASWILFSILLLPDKHIPLLLAYTVVSICSLLIAGVKIPDKPTADTRVVNHALSFLIISGMAFLARSFVRNTDSWGGIIATFGAFNFVFLTIATIIFARVIAAGIINHHAFKRVSVRTVLRQIRLSKIIFITLVALVLIGAVFYSYAAPTNNKPAATIQVDNCTVQDTFVVATPDNKLLSVYPFSVKNRNYTSQTLILSAILKQDGDYEDIDLLSQTNKSNIQYYELDGPSGGFGYLYMRFYDKNIYYIDGLNWTLKRRTC